MGESMADQGILHTADIMKAALPFIDARHKGMFEIIMKLFDLLAYLKSLNSTVNMTASTQESAPFDFEGMLNSIRPVCNKKERDIVDKLLNFFHMKRAFEMYNKMTEAMNSMQDFEGFSFEDTGKEAETVTEDFAGMDFDSIFSDSKEDAPADDIFSSDDSDQNDSPDAKSPDSEGSQSTGTGFKINDKMLEMLKTMVPPEKQSTFENLSMLLNSVSYDNNKPDDSKEHSDG